MRILLRPGCLGRGPQDLEYAGHDVVWSGDRKQDPGDSEILEIAHREGRILVTLDKDFGELVLAYRISHGGILRLVNFPARQQALACLKVLELHDHELRQRAIITAEPGRLRIRPSESGAQ